MLIAAQKVQAYTTGVTWEAFSRNEMLQDATVRRLEIIGEAAREVTQATRDAHPEIPGRIIVGMRHRIVHEYFRVDLQKVWDAIQNSIPELIALLEPIVPPPKDATPR
ncbi:MAG: HepT-like ribonuclease domain-containing protein [Chloroflexota bacterium]